jgi:hypothetical protein
MNCEQVAEFLLNYLYGHLSAEQNLDLAEHVEHCAGCRDEIAVWKKLSLVEDEEPSPASRERFETMLHAYRTGWADRSPSDQKPDSLRRGLGWFHSPVAGLAWSIAFLVIGIFAGNYMNRHDSRSDSLAAMQSELANTRQLVVLSMLQQQSASERLQAVSLSQREDQLDPKVLAALLSTLRYDASVSVRLSALDALSRHASQLQVRRDISDALQAKQSPLVQVALIDLLTKWRDPGDERRLRDLRQSTNLNPAVRQRVDAALSKLN